MPILDVWITLPSAATISSFLFARSIIKWESGCVFPGVDRIKMLKLAANLACHLLRLLLFRLDLLFVICENEIKLNTLLVTCEAVQHSSALIHNYDLWNLHDV